MKQEIAFVILSIIAVFIGLFLIVIGTVLNLPKIVSLYLIVIGSITALVFIFWIMYKEYKR